MCITAMNFWTFGLCALHAALAFVPAATLRAPYTQRLDGNTYWDRGSSQTSRPSYVIYDYNTNYLPNSRDERPVVSSTRPWHLEFSKRQNAQPTQPSIAYQPVYSNLIQVVDNPQRKYYGPYDTSSYLEPERGFYNYPRPKTRPAQVPTYEVEYPYENPQKNFYGERLPERFPATFLPEKGFNPNEPSEYDGPRRGFEFHRTQTVNYGVNNADSGVEDRRGRRREQCNYIRLNEKGFPLGSEMCGRSIPDVLLPPDYPNTGDLALEHRKRYRGVERGRSLESEINEEKNKTETERKDRKSGEMTPEKRNIGEILSTRRKRSTQGYPKDGSNLKISEATSEIRNFGEVLSLRKKRSTQAFPTDNTNQKSREKNVHKENIGETSSARWKRSMQGVQKDGINQKIAPTTPEKRSFGEVLLLRNKRNTQGYPTRFDSCCSGASRGYGYGYRPYYESSNYNDDDYRRGYDLNYEGQYRDNDGDDVGEETSDNHGLTSYMSSRGRGYGGRHQDSEEDSEEDNSKGKGRDNHKANQGNGSKGRKSNNKSQNNRDEQSSQHSDRSFDDRNQQHGTHRKFGDFDSGDDRHSVSYSRNGNDYGSHSGSYPTSGSDYGSYSGSYPRNDYSSSRSRGSNNREYYGSSYDNYGRNGGVSGMYGSSYGRNYGTGYGASYGRGSSSYGLGSFGYK